LAELIDYSLNHEKINVITGGSGYLGRNIFKNPLEESFYCLGRSGGCDEILDLSSIVPGFKEINEMNCVIHAAGKAHLVPRDLAEEEDFYKVNVDGTRNLLKGIDVWIESNVTRVYPKQFVFISTVAVYGLEGGVDISENQVLEPVSAYGKSKLEAEKLVLDWGKEHGVNILILRLPLIFGMGAPGNLGAMEKAIKKGYYFRIGSGNAVRSMVDVEQLSKFLVHLDGSESGMYNLVSYHRSFKEVEQIFSDKFHKRIKVIPSWMAKFAAQLGDVIPGFPLNSYRLKKLESSLTFDCSKAEQQLGWKKL
jgi:nucleoside-diphosphate-sugar epimerase